MIALKGLILVLVPIVLAKPFENEPVCGYEACPATDPNKINVHLIPHTHDDVGWLKTPDQYFYQDVRDSLTAVVNNLKENANRRFIFVETYFFHKWWVLQPENVKKDVIDLVNQGRFEFINTGWSMNDEAVVHYQSTIDQFTLGHKYLDEIFGKCARPKIGWQIDTFGHSKAQASIYAKMGFDAFFINRMDYRDKDKRMKEKNTEFLWDGSYNVNDSQVFTSILYRHYNHPPGFCFDRKCGDPVIVTDPESSEYNWQERVETFAKYIEEHWSHYKTNNILVTMGDDFMYLAASKNFENMDLLISGFDKFKPKVNGKEVNIMYSTPTCYTKAVNEFTNKNKTTLTVKDDDFLPHADSSLSYWTGFLSSRPTSKRMEKISNNLLQIANQLAAASSQDYWINFKLKDAVGEIQHHDAITGTEKEHVVKEYHRLLALGIKDSAQNIKEALKNIFGVSQLQIENCLLANSSICLPAKKDEFNVILYNPLGRPVSHHVQIPVDGKSWKITGLDGKEIPNVANSPIRDFDFVAKNISSETSSHVLHFDTYLPSVGYLVYNVKKVKEPYQKSITRPPYPVESLGNSSVMIDPNGKISEISINNISIKLNQDFVYYISGDNSGAYTFEPKGRSTEATVLSNKVNVTVTLSSDLLEIRQVFADWAIQIIRLYKDADFVEFDWAIGPVDVKDGERGREMLSRFSTDLKTNSTFYTDSNGREMIQRIRNYRKTYQWTNEEPIAGNFFPVTSRIVLKDEEKGIEFAVITDRPQSGASLKDGQVELMVHRAITGQDGTLGENVYEIEYGQGLIARGTHYVTIGKSKREGDQQPAAVQQKQLAQEVHLQPWMFISQEDWTRKNFSLITKKLQDNVHLLTLDKWSLVKNQILLRLEHSFEMTDDPDVLSKNAEFDLEDLFINMKVVALKEVTINGIIPLSEVNRLKWPGQNSEEVQKSVKTDGFKITLTPMEIRTFIVDVKPVPIPDEELTLNNY